MVRKEILLTACFSVLAAAAVAAAVLLTATDFQTLTIDVKGENLRKRNIQVPTARELTDR